MRWNLRLTAANKGIWKASELQRSLAEHGLVISAGKMSGLWSGQPVSLKLEDLDVICVVLGCEIGDLLIPGPQKVTRPGEEKHRPDRCRRRRTGSDGGAQASRWPVAAACMSRYPKGYCKSTDSCDCCLAWGDFSGRLCPACYMFGRSHAAAGCAGCRRVQPLKWDYCRLCWCQARPGPQAAVDRLAAETDVRARLNAVRHHQLFFMGMHHRNGSAPAPRKPPPAPAWRPNADWRQLWLFGQAPCDYGRLDPGRHRPGQPVAGLGEVPLPPA